MSLLITHADRAMTVSPVIPTRGNVDMRPIFKSLRTLPYDDGYIWNNGGEHEDLGVYGRYAAIARVSAPVIYTQDDDVILPPESIEALLAAYKPGKVVCNVPERFRKRYYDSGLVGFGAVFDRDLPEQAFARAGITTSGTAMTISGAILDDAWEHRHDDPERFSRFLRTCDIVFTMLTPLVFVDLPYTELPYAHDNSRMWKQPNHFEERDEMRKLCRQIRDGN